MKKLLTVLTLLTTASAFAHIQEPTPISIDQIKCVADKYPHGRVEVPVKMTMGSVPDDKFEHGGSELAIGFYPGNGYENQQVLAMEVDGSITSIHDPGNSLYMLKSNRVRLQCYIKKVARTESVKKNLVCDSYNSKLIDLDNGEAVYDFSSNGNCEAAKENVLLGKPFCDDYNSSLFTSNAVLIHDFSSNGNCAEAIERVHQKKNFCDEYDSTLRKSNGDLIYDFSSNADCKKALN